MSMSCCGWTSCFKAVNSDQAHTHSPAHFSYTMPVTHPTARTQDISACRPFSAGANGSSTPCGLLFLIHRTILLKHDARYPVVHICHHKCLLEVDVEMTTQDVTVKLGMCRCSVVHQLTFKNHTSYIYDGRTATLQMLHFIYFFFNKYKY